MPKMRFSAEQIAVLLRQIEVLMSQGKTPAVACREAGISRQSYCRWRKQYGLRPIYSNYPLAPVILSDIDLNFGSASVANESLAVRR